MSITETATPTEVEQRAAYTAGLRALAELLDAHPDFPLPSDGASEWTQIDWFVTTESDDAQRRLAREFIRLVPGAITKSPRDNWMDVNGQLHGLHLSFTVNRDAVCVRRVVGTREVTKEVVDPDAPKVTVTETVEDVEWDCQPILRGPVAS